jgi:hypothetical protein
MRSMPWLIVAVPKEKVEWALKVSLRLLIA